MFAQASDAFFEGSKIQVVLRRLCLLTWLLSFPKKEVMLGTPHLQSPAHMGRNRSSCGYTVKERICRWSRSSVGRAGRYRGKVSRSQRRRYDRLDISFEIGRHKVVDGSSGT